MCRAMTCGKLVKGPNACHYAAHRKEQQQNHAAIHKIDWHIIYNHSEKINDGWDPEASRKVSGNGRFPFNRTCTVGLDLTF